MRGAWEQFEERFYNIATFVIVGVGTTAFVVLVVIYLWLLLDLLLP